MNNTIATSRRLTIILTSVFVDAVLVVTIFGPNMDDTVYLAEKVVRHRYRVVTIITFLHVGLNYTITAGHSAVITTQIAVDGVSSSCLPPAWTRHPTPRPLMRTGMRRCIGVAVIALFTALDSSVSTDSRRHRINNLCIGCWCG